MTLTEVITQVFLASKEVISKGVVIALIAAWMGASAKRSATKKANEYATKKTEEDENRLTKNTLLLLKVEMTTAWDIYTKEYLGAVHDLAGVHIPALIGADRVNVDDLTRSRFGRCTVDRLGRVMAKTKRDTTRLCWAACLRAIRSSPARVILAPIGTPTGWRSAFAGHR